jgi:hypothetical protein
MRMLYKGDFDKTRSYPAGSIVRKNRDYLVLTYRGDWEPVAAPPDASCAGPSGKDGRDGRHGIDGKAGRDGVDGRDGRDGERGERGKRGPRGREGATYYSSTTRRIVEAGSGVVETITALFASITSKGAPLYIDGAAVELAQADGIVNVVGVAAEDVVNGAEGRYRTEGQLERDDWTPVAGTALLSPGAVYYLSPDTPGQITATATTTPGHVVLIIGRALTPTTLDVEIGSPILLSETEDED